MRRLLVINPTPCVDVSAMLQAHVQRAAGTMVKVRTATARFGAPYVACEASYAVAGHAALDAWAVELAQGGSPPDAVLVGCFGDPGLLALRETSRAPVTGLAEASFHEARQFGRFAVVTGGERWKPMLQRLAQNLGFGDSLAGIHTLSLSGAQLAQDPKGAATLLAIACREAVRDFGAQAIVIGGAGLTGLASTMQPALEVPLIDSVVAGTRRAMRGKPFPPAHASGRFSVLWTGVSRELAARGLAPVVSP